MRLNALKKSLLILALLLGQWLMAAHALEHAAAGADQICQLCLHAQGLDSAAAPVALPALALLHVAEAPPVTAPAIIPTVVPASYSIRGPPLFV